MKITFFSEDFTAGITRDWPVVPRVGEIVQFQHKGGVAALAVDKVEYWADTDGRFHSTQVNLIYPDADTYILHELRSNN